MLKNKKENVESESGSSTHQDVQAGSFQERDLVCDGQPCEARHSFGKFHDLDNALSGQLAELVPQAQVQPHTVVCTRVLQHTHTVRVRVGVRRQ